MTENINVENSIAIDQSTVRVGDVGIRVGEIDEREAVRQGMLKLIVCSGVVISVSPGCKNEFPLGVKITVPCSDLGCPISSNHKLLFDCGWVVADQSTDCHEEWFDGEPQLTDIG